MLVWLSCESAKVVSILQRCLMDALIFYFSVREHMLALKFG